MMFDFHEILEPAWIKSLVEDVLLESVLPLGFIGPLGYRWIEPANKDNSFDGWQIYVFPTPNEIRGPVAFDGCKTVSGFKLEISKIIGSMTNISSIVWNSPTQFNGNFDGPEISIQGYFANKHVLLRFFNLPPIDEPCAFFIDPTTNTVKEISLD